jgi:hypothetical protein
VFNATFNNISVISWWTVLLVEEAGGPRENHRPVESKSEFVQFIQVFSEKSHYRILVSSMTMDKFCLW